MTMSCGIQRLPGTKYRFGNRKYIHRKRGHQRSTQSCPAAGAEVGVIDDSSDDDVEEICTVQETKTLRPSEATENVIVRSLRDFLLMARNEQRHFVQCVGAIEDAFLRMRVAEQRQSKISEFF